MGYFEVHFLQMKPNLISHLKFVQYPMFIMALLVLGIGFLHNLMNLLLDVLGALNKFCFPISLFPSKGGIFLCDCNGKSYVNGGQ
jgi:hypothetical protein